MCSCEESQEEEGQVRSKDPHDILMKKVILFNNRIILYVTTDILIKMLLAIELEIYLS